MTTTPRRRACVELLVCAAMCAAVAAHPALGAPHADKPDHGKQTAPGQLDKVAPAAPAAAAAPAPAAPAAPAPPAQGGGPKGAAPHQKSAAAQQGSRQGSGKASAKAKPSAPQRRSPAAPATGGRGHKAGASTTPSGGRSSATTTSNQPSKKTTPPGRSSTAASRNPGRSSAATTPPARSSSAAPATTATPASPADAASPAAAGNPAPPAAAAAPQPQPQRAASGQASQGAAPATPSRRPLVELRDRLLGIGTPAAGAAAPSGSPLQTPGAALGVRELDGVETSRPQRTKPGVEPMGGRASTLTTVLRGVRGVAKVVPMWVWIALAVLSCLVLLLGVNTILAAARTRRLERQRTKLLEDVGMLQAALLPVVPARLSGVPMTVAYRPADGLAAGGDFYDAFALPDGRVGLLLGDVSGHGREALAKTALVRFTVRAHLEAGMSPREAISIAGRSLDGRLGDDFATVIAAVHDPSRGTLTYSSAGHPPPLVVGPSAHVALTASSAPPIDAGFPTGQRQTVLPMAEGSIVALYSDGLIEARIDGEPIGTERLTAWLADLGPEATAERLVELVVERADRLRDDLAVVILHAAPGATSPAHRVEQLKLDVLDAEGPDLDVFLHAACVGRAERRLIGRRASEELAVTGGVIVEVLATEPPRIDVSPIGGRGAGAPRSRARAR